jgi:hypothetical protein
MVPPDKNQFDYTSSLINAFDQNTDPDSAEGPTIAITSCAQGSGSAQIVIEVINKALSMEKTIVFIDFNSKKPVSLNIEKKNQLSLSAFLSAQGPLVSRGVLTWVSPQNGDKLNEEFTGKEINLLLEKAREMSDFVLVRPPAILNNNLSELIISQCDQVYFVMKQEKTSYYEVQHAINRSRRIGKEPTGLIFNARRLLIPEFIYQMFFHAR